MAKVSKETYPGVSENARKENLAKVDNVLKENRDTGKLYTSKKVRQTIEELGGTMPEKLPTPENIKESKKRIKQASKKLLQQ